MSTNFLLRSYVSGKTYTERWTTWTEAQRAKPKLESVGHRVTIQWLNPECRLIDVTDLGTNPEG